LRAFTVALIGLCAHACVVHPADYAGRACDEQHACLDGRVCVANRCVDAAAGGGSGGGGACTGGAETCNGVDDDCNGIVDDVTGCIYTVAGEGPPAFRDGKGTAAAFASPLFLASDTSGAVLVADSLNHALRKIAADGTVSTLAGDGRCGFRDGPVASAQLCEPTAVEVAGDGTLYFTDTGNHRLRKISAGVVSTLAGNGSPGSGNGAALGPTLSDPRGLALLPNGDVLIADSQTHRIRRYAAGSQQMSTEAGTSQGSSDGTRASVQLDTPWDVAMTSSGDLLVSENGANRVRRIPASGSSSALAGSTSSGYAEGSGTSARFDRLSQLSLEEDAGLA
jgi:hypothetical protein